MDVELIVRNIIGSRGLRQTRAINRMNEVSPSLGMNHNKLSAIVCGSRKMTGDELLAFCMATETKPDCFCRAGKRPGA